MAWIEPQCANGAKDYESVIGEEQSMKAENMIMLQLADGLVRNFISGIV